MRKNSGIAEVWRRLKKNKTAMLGLAILMIFLVFIVFADFIADYQDMAIAQDYANALAAPSAEHWFGTDEYGRDIFARVIHGGRYSLLLGIATTAVSILVASIIGAATAYYGGLVDSIVMRILDMFMGIPLLLLAITIAAALGSGLRNLAIALIISLIPSFTRVIRSVILNISGSDYIEAAKAYGTSDLRIIASQMIPNAIGPIIVQATMSVANVILSATALSYLGMGMQPPTPEWGAMLSDGKEFMRYSPYVVTFPGLAIALSALSLNLLGDGLRDALDPKLKN
ncbi:MAG TPA: ABC transporter permease [Candidatus Flavonifractor merdigallinarum]|uniref:ABC transporter permease n=1 Tax=Candidatus Flavonifractor merdigallinarum TaxID=2838589 RepID=A0A9D1Y8M2_9FIRM|nr:ABC transporter permease [Candidatus Flavonifractor merdigallinarum]